MKLSTFLRKLWITWFDLIADPGLSRRLDYMISWCPFQPESSCDHNLLWYDKVHTKILIWSAAVKHMCVTQKSKKKGTLCMVKNWEVEGRPWDQHSIVGYSWNQTRAVSIGTSASTSESFCFWFAVIQIILQPLVTNLLLAIRHTHRYWTEAMQEL